MWIVFVCKLALALLELLFFSFFILVSTFVFVPVTNRLFLDS